ncbi:MAG TPA: diacylglycerol kinase family protein [Tepidisphaeraceae bacterium]|jgi:YegS/Rv2252/BmrU family lipid kinase
MARLLIFANPIAGQGKGKRIALALQRRLGAQGWKAEVVFEKPGELTDEQIVKGTKAAIAIGGDGTIRGVAARLHAAAKKPIPMLIVPMGTANLLGRHLGIRWHAETVAEEVAQVLAHHRIIELDAAVANTELFLLMAGIGLDAQVVHELDRIRRGPIDYTSYVLPAAMALAKYRFAPVTVRVDEKVIADEIPAVAFVGNVREYGTGFAILPHAVPNDGLLDVCVLPCANPKDLVFHLMRAVTGDHLLAEGSIYVKGKRVQVTSEVPVPVQIDGDAAGYTPLDVDLLGVRLPFIVPK